MRALSALAFVISIFGVLVVILNQFALIPALNHLYSPEIKSTDFTNLRTIELENSVLLWAVISLITGVVSVIFCSFMYLQKKTRMTLIGMFVGFAVTVISIVHLL